VQQKRRGHNINEAFKRLLGLDDQDFHEGCDSGNSSDSDFSSASPRTDAGKDKEYGFSGDMVRRPSFGSSKTDRGERQDPSSSAEKVLKAKEMGFCVSQAGTLEQLVDYLTVENVSGSFLVLVQQKCSYALSHRYKLP
jgi:hypothetical protein